MGIFHRFRVPAPVSPADARSRLDDLASRDKDASLASLSRMLRRRDGYLATFVRDGAPERLERKDRDLLAAYFRVDPFEFGEARDADAAA
ncbi:peptidase S24 [Sphingomonas immobilis]|uniref:Peptidase S24 n=1 Tax=Sphingomonas immobilis TaxID=3063997 RepID=A0ABT9A0X5_9SPHN|nr:peptidase S24 [Sphingomonas sp. CA1-15]MDO7843481.1 peptidase S24 [Sphingomonas sp. CA1-15]